MTNEDILDQFGQHCVKAFDKAMGFPKNKLSDLNQTSRYMHLLALWQHSRKRNSNEITFNIIEGMLFDFLKIFE